MTDRLDALRSLLERVEGAQEGSHELGCTVVKALVPEWMIFSDARFAVSTSLDAALDLLGRVLPGCAVHIDIYPEPYAENIVKIEGDRLYVRKRAVTPALALLAAMLRALVAREEARDA